jgi:hypothetical protein
MLPDLRLGDGRTLAPAAGLGARREGRDGRHLPRPARAALRDGLGDRGGGGGHGRLRRDGGLLRRLGCRIGGRALGGGALTGGTEDDGVADELDLEPVARGQVELLPRGRGSVNQPS